MYSQSGYQYLHPCSQKLASIFESFSLLIYTSINRDGKIIPNVKPGSRSLLASFKQGRDYLMTLTLTLKRAGLIIILALGLLAGLISMTANTFAAPNHPASTSSSTQFASRGAGPNYYCPPPPYDCF
jgi:hypothetical protein